MNRYIPCPHCGSQNREVDTSCYQCGKPLDAAPAEPAAGLPSEGPIPPGPEARLLRRGFDIEKPDRDSTVIHGLRSGAIAGAITGIVCGLFCSFFGSMLAGAAVDSMAALGLAGVVIFIIIFIGQVIYGTIIGAILGGMNVLCYQADCMKIGGIAGLIVSIILWLTHMSGFTGIFSGMVHGAILGYLASYIERRVFRKQYAEL